MRFRQGAQKPQAVALLHLILRKGRGVLIGEGRWKEEGEKRMAHEHICLRSGCSVDCDLDEECPGVDVEECKELCAPCVVLNLIDDFEDEEN